MKLGAFLLALLWFSGSAYAGYRLTERSFAWIDEPNFGLTPEASTAKDSSAFDLETLKGLSPEALRQKAKELNPQQLLCLRAAIPSDRLSSVLAGDLTPQEAAAVQKCLE